VKTVTLGGGTAISGVCTTELDDEGCTSQDEVDIIFRRPHLSADIVDLDSADEVVVTLTSSGGLERTVRASRAGRVSVGSSVVAEDDDGGDEGGDEGGGGDDENGIWIGTGDTDCDNDPPGQVAVEDASCSPVGGTAWHVVSSCMFGFWDTWEELECQ
jgi:hypothetical protein